MLQAFKERFLTVGIFVLCFIVETVLVNKPIEQNKVLPLLSLLFY